MQPQIRKPPKAAFTPGASLREYFDAYVEGAYDRPEFILLLSGLCTQDPDSVWEVLALLDQYDRKGQLRAADFASFKTDLEQTGCRATPSSQFRVRKETGATSDSSTMEIAHASPVARRTPPVPERSTNRPSPVRLTRTPLPQPPPAAPSGFARFAPKAPVDLAPGSVLRNRFVLEAVLGSGGMGTVFKALDKNRGAFPEGDRHVAIKVLRPELEVRPEALEILAREFNQAQRLSHPGIVKVFDFDSDQGRHFITMELLPGRTLEQMLASRRDLPPLERSVAWAILRDLGDAIAHAHERGIVHADLKPANAMFADTGQLRVLDFGMAHALPVEPWILDSPAPFLAATRTYASCQRLEGNVPDARDDIFSFACVCYEVLTGTHPFGRRSALEARQADLKPKRPAGLGRRQWRALVQALAWERQDRPASIGYLLGELHLARSEAPSGVKTSERVRGTWGRGATGAIALICVALAWVWSVGTENGVRPFAATSLVAAAASVTQTARDWLQMAAGKVASLSPEAPVPIRDSGTTPVPAPMPASIPEPARPAPASDTIADAVIPDVPAGESSATPLPLQPAGQAPSPEMPVRPVTRPGTFELAADNFTVSEAVNAVRLEVRRTGGTSGVVSFRWRTTADNALAGEDFASFGTVTETLQAGQSSAVILVPIVMDGIPEDSEAFSIEILDPAGGALLGSVTRSTVVIIDDD